MTQNFFIDLAEDNIMNVVRFFRGDNHTLNFYIQNDGDIFDLSGYTAKFSVKKELTDTAYSFYADNIVPGSGVITVEIEPADTEGLDAGEYYYDLEISGTKTITVVSDILEVKSDVTTSVVVNYIVTENSQKLIFE